MASKLRARWMVVLKKADGCQHTTEASTRRRPAHDGRQHTTDASAGQDAGGGCTLTTCAHEEMRATRRPGWTDTPKAQPNLLMGARGAVANLTVRRAARPRCGGRRRDPASRWLRLEG